MERGVESEAALELGLDRLLALDGAAPNILDLNRVLRPCQMEICQTTSVRAFSTPEQNFAYS